MNRYIRQLQLKGIGKDGQQLLASAHVGIIGCGALGSMVAMYLAGAGIGSLTIADFDNVDLTNLQRQLFYKETDLGKPKAELLKQRILELNSEIEVNVCNGFIRKTELEKIAAQTDILIDASDNPDTKYLVSDTSHSIGKPCIIGGVSGWQGQVLTCVSGKPYYRDVFPDADSNGFTPCSIGGVVGPVAGMVACAQAVETIKFLTGAEDTLSGRILVIDAWKMKFHTLNID